MAGRKIYLIDTENVGSAWTELLPERSGKDEIILFFTENSPGLSYRDLDMIRKFPESFDLIECITGRNGLDFQLVSYLGYLIKTAPKTEYVIVTNDTGFDAVVGFWSQRGISVVRKSKSELTTPEKKEDMTAEVLKILRELLPEEVSEEESVENVYKILCDYSIKQLQKLYSALLKEYGQNTGSDVYRRLKPQIRNLYRMIPR